MKRKVKVAILGAMLHCSAQAAEQSMPVDPSLIKAQEKTVAVHGKPATGEQGKAAKPKKIKPVAKPAKSKKAAQQQQEGAMESPIDSTEQSVQLRGLRG